MTGRATLAWVAIAFIVGLGLLLLQPLLISGALGKGPVAGRAHAWVGTVLVVAIILHVVGLCITSPPDVIDLLLSRSHTPFRIWGAVAMWSAFGPTICAAVRRQFRLRAFRAGHMLLAMLTIIGTVLHALMIEGAMEQLSKAILCMLVLTATVWSIWKRKSLRNIPISKTR